MIAFSFDAACMRRETFTDVRSTLVIAPEGHTFAHWGSPSHRSHFKIFRPWVSYQVDPKGHTFIHVRH